MENSQTELQKHVPFYPSYMRFSNQETQNILKPVPRRQRRRKADPAKQRQPLTEKKQHLLETSQGEADYQPNQSDTKKSTDPTQATKKEAAPKVNKRKKYELCKNFSDQGECKYGEKCLFAHGKHELYNYQPEEES